MLRLLATIIDPGQVARLRRLTLLFTDGRNWHDSSNQTVKTSADVNYLFQYVKNQSELSNIWNYVWRKIKHEFSWEQI